MRITDHRRRGDSRVILLAWVAYTLASLLHYAHNAALLEAYPNLPPWLTRPQVYIAWMALAVVGTIGFRLTKSRHHWVGLAVLAVYGMLGFGGLAHYLVAPVSAHTAAMNATILLESTAAALLLIAILRTVRTAVNRSLLPSSIDGG